MTRSSNIILDYSIKVSSIDCDSFVDWFGSTTISRLYQSGHIYADIREDYLQLTDHYWDLLDIIEGVMAYINNCWWFYGCWLVLP